MKRSHRTVRDPNLGSELRQLLTHTIIVGIDRDSRLPVEPRAAHRLRWRQGGEWIEHWRAERSEMPDIARQNRRAVMLPARAAVRQYHLRSPPPSRPRGTASCSARTTSSTQRSGRGCRPPRPWHKTHGQDVRSSPHRSRFRLDPRRECRTPRHAGRQIVAHRLSPCEGGAGSFAATSPIFLSWEASIAVRSAWIASSRMVGNSILSLRTTQP